MCSESTAPCCNKVTSFTSSVLLLRRLPWLPVKCRILFKTFLLINKTLPENSLFIFTSCLPHHSHAVHWDHTKESVCQSLGSRSMQVQEHFTFVLRFAGTTIWRPSNQPVQLQPSINVSRHISMTWPFSHRHQYSQWLRWGYGTPWLILLLNTDLAEPSFIRDIGAIKMCLIN